MPYRRTPRPPAARSSGRTKAGAKKHPAISTVSTRKSGKLTTYNAKRDFRKTAEPVGATHATTSRNSLRFVIQKHAASHLHFDLRLELDGAMKSWAVPKGPNYDPTAKRLAMEVEDHPIEYTRFEGTIPEGEYGGGTVMIWDRGVYWPMDDGGEAAVRRGFDRGELKFVMEGSRMLGGWVLVRTNRDDRGRARWLLMKLRDDYAQSGFDVVEMANTSIVTGRTMDEIARGVPSEERPTTNRTSDAPSPVRRARA